MVRTRKESSNETSPKKPLSLTQWSRKHWLDPWKCVAGNIKHRNVHQLKAKNNPASQLKQSNQKKVGTRIKDRNWKWRAVDDPEGIAKGLTNCTHSDKRACKEVFECMKICAHKSVKTILSSTQMLFKVASCFCVWIQITFGTRRSNIHNLFQLRSCC